MSPNIYVVPRKGRTSLATDRETLIAVKAYGKQNGMTGVAALRLIVRKGLTYLMAEEELEHLEGMRKYRAVLRKAIMIDRDARERAIAREKTTRVRK